MDGFVCVCVYVCMCVYVNILALSFLTLSSLLSHKTHIHTHTSPPVPDLLVRIVTSSTQPSSPTAFSKAACEYVCVCVCVCKCQVRLQKSFTVIVYLHI